MSKQTEKVVFRCTPEQKQAFTEWADEFGMSLSAFMSIAAWTGAKMGMRQASPERFISPQILESMRAMGYDVPERIGNTEDEQ